MLFRGGSANLYQYVHGDPINFIDPRGIWEVAGGASATADLAWGNWGWSRGINAELATNNQTGLYEIEPLPTPLKSGGILASVGLTGNFAVGEEGATWNGPFENISIAFLDVGVTVFWSPGDGPSYYGIDWGLGFGLGAGRFSTNYDPIWKPGSGPCP